MVKDVYQHLYEFQLTRLMRGVTRKFARQYFIDMNFNSHASCEA